MVADRRIPERALMPTQKRETGKNYIGILSDEIEEQCATEVRYVCHIIPCACMYSRI